MKQLCLSLFVLISAVSMASAQNQNTHVADSLQLAGESEKANAVAMAGYVYEPVVLAQKQVPLSDFYLWYPVSNQSWIKTPNAMDKESDQLVKATLIPAENEDIYFSAKGEDGKRNIYRTHFEDGLWSVPEPLFESLTANSNEIYPYVSDDGKKLWFASDGLYGVGGYDLYVCNWNESHGDWDVPVNMGFPFSSPGDDLFYMDTPDGKYSVFASTRGCGKDRINVYVLEFDNMPIRKQITDPSHLKDILRLKVKNGDAVADLDVNSSEASNAYTEKLEEVRRLTDSMDAYVDRIEKLRKKYGEEPGPDLEAMILSCEKDLPGRIAEIDAAKKELQAIELGMLHEGIIVNPDELTPKSQITTQGAGVAYAFSKKAHGAAPAMEFREPESKFDYSFQILPQGQYAEDQKLPDGVIYQVHYITLTTKATMAQLRGLSPVYETKLPNGNYVYRVGIFRTYAEANEALPRVKAKGFSSASVVAFRNGKSCSIAEARANEGGGQMWKVEIPTAGSLPAEVSAAIRQNCEKDLSKSYGAGQVIYVIAPFESKEEADRLLVLIKAAGAEDARVAKIEE